MTTCPSCHEEVLPTPNGLLLEPHPHLLGIHTPTGGTLTAADIRGRVRGHRKHWCNPKAAATPAPQNTLFD